MALLDPTPRLISLADRQSVLIRQTASMYRGTDPVIGMAPIKLPGEDRLQAIALGLILGPPLVVTLPEPLSATDQPALDRVGAYVAGLMADVDNIQIWIPDKSCFDAIKIEGIRHRRNLQVSADRQFFAIFCYAIYRMWHLPGQQVVAIATNLLAQHLCTGQTAAEDAHLGARLAWDAPVPGEPPWAVAEARRRRPGPSLLAFDDEVRANELRGKISKGLRTAADMEELDRILRDAAHSSWQLLVEAYHVYLNLPVRDLPGLNALVRDSKKSFNFLLRVSPAFGATLSSTVWEFRMRERWHDRWEDLNTRGDPLIREIRRREGRVIAATVLRVRQGKEKSQATSIRFRSNQAVRRMRIDTQFKTHDDRIRGVVKRIRHDRGSAYFTLLVQKGTKVAADLLPGQSLDLFDTAVYFGLQKRTDRVKRTALELNLAVQPLCVPDDLIGFAQGLRK